MSLALNFNCPGHSITHLIVTVFKQQNIKNELEWAIAEQKIIQGWIVLNMVQPMDSYPITCIILFDPYVPQRIKCFVFFSLLLTLPLPAAPFLFPSHSLSFVFSSLFSIQKLPAVPS